MKYLMIGGIVLFAVYTLLFGEVDGGLLEDIRTMIPAVPSWLSDIV